MIKFYLSTVAIYFMIYIASGILFKKEFRKARDKVRKELNDNSKINGNIKTTFIYIIISFIPFIRLIGLIGKYYMILNPDEYIKRVKEKVDNDD